MHSSCKKVSPGRTVDLAREGHRRAAAPARRSKTPAIAGRAMGVRSERLEDTACSAQARDCMCRTQPGEIARAALTDCGQHYAVLGCLPALQERTSVSTLSIVMWNRWLTCHAETPTPRELAKHIPAHTEQTPKPAAVLNSCSMSIT